MHTQQKLSLLALSALFASVAAQEEVPLFIPQTYVDAGALSLSIEGGAAALGGAETTIIGAYADPAVPGFTAVANAGVWQAEQADGGTMSCALDLNNAYCNYANPAANVYSYFQQPLAPVATATVDDASSTSSVVVSTTSMTSNTITSAATSSSAASSSVIAVGEGAANEGEGAPSNTESTTPTFFPSQTRAPNVFAPSGASMVNPAMIMISLTGFATAAFAFL